MVLAKAIVLVGLTSVTVFNFLFISHNYGNYKRERVAIGLGLVLFTIVDLKLKHI